MGTTAATTGGRVVIAPTEQTSLRMIVLILGAMASAIYVFALFFWVVLHDPIADDDPTQQGDELEARRRMPTRSRR
jgi:hypothetical protein